MMIQRNIKVKLVFDSWWSTDDRYVDSDAYNEAIIDPSLHGGTTYSAEIDLDESEIKRIKKFAKAGLRPRFLLFNEDDIK